MRSFDDKSLIYFVVAFVLVIPTWFNDNILAWYLTDNSRLFTIAFLIFVWMDGVKEYFLKKTLFFLLLSKMLTIVIADLQYLGIYFDLLWLRTILYLLIFVFYLYSLNKYVKGWNYDLSN